MTLSPHFQTLSDSFHELANCYLSERNAAVTPTGQQQELARAFVVLCHAEIESFIEAIAADVSAAAVKNMNAGQANVTAMNMLTFSNLEPNSAGEFVIPSGSKQLRKLSTRLGAATARQKEAIEDNNGISQKYMAKMLVPLGITSEVIDPVWVNLVDAFANKRGAFAHKSKRSVEAKPDALNPSDVYSDATRIIFRDPKLPAEIGISSFQCLDAWAQNMPNIRMSSQGNNSKHKNWTYHTLWALTRFVDKINR